VGSGVDLDSRAPEAPELSRRAAAASIELAFRAIVIPLDKIDDLQQLLDRAIKCARQPLKESPYAEEPDYFVASVLHVRRAGTIVAIPFGVMSSETDLSDDEIAQFKALGALRKPTMDEWETVQARLSGETPALERSPSCRWAVMARNAEEIEELEIELDAARRLKYLATRHVESLTYSLVAAQGMLDIAEKQEKYIAAKLAGVKGPQLTLSAGATS